MTRRPRRQLYAAAGLPWDEGAANVLYPVSVSVAPSLTNRNRLTTAFRLVLATPHLILVGGIGIGVASRADGRTTVGSEGGLLGAVAIVLAIVSWFTILLSGKQDPLNDQRLVDESDQAQPSSAPRARQHVESKTAPHQLRPEQVRPCLRRSAALRTPRG